jgi:hypothetical protein
MDLDGQQGDGDREHRVREQDQPMKVLCFLVGDVGHARPAVCPAPFLVGCVPRAGHGGKSRVAPLASRAANA